MMLLEYNQPSQIDKPPAKMINYFIKFKNFFIITRKTFKIILLMWMIFFKWFTKHTFFFLKNFIDYDSVERIHWKCKLIIKIEAQEKKKMSKKNMINAINWPSKVKQNGVKLLVDSDSFYFLRKFLLFFLCFNSFVT